MGTRTLRDQEGYFLMDNRNNEGVPDDLVRACGLPAGAGRGVFEAPCFTCTHCNGVTVMNPNRQQPRNYCKRCDHLICDPCATVMAQTKEHKTFKEFVNDLLEDAEKPSGPAPQLILP